MSDPLSRWLDADPEPKPDAKDGPEPWPKDEHPVWAEIDGYAARAAGVTVDELRRRYKRGGSAPAPVPRRE